MYYGVTPLIPIPEDSDKGKVIVSKKGYVYLQVGYTWDSKKRQPHYERKIIGRTDEKQPDLMYYSPEYEAIFGAVDTELEEIRKRIDGLHLKQAGKTNAYISFGPFVAVQAVCEKVGCLSPLKRIFNSSWKLVLGLCVHAIAAENTTAQAFPGWCFNNYAGMNRVVADTEISRLYKDIASRSGDIDAFFALFWKEYGKTFPKTGHRVVGFDSTNQNYYGKGIPLAKAGHAKIDAGTPIINTAMFVDGETGIPLWYEHYDGSLLDKNQTPFSLKKVVNAGYSKLFIVFDRGYYSEEDVEGIEQLDEIGFGILCPDGTNWVEDLIRTRGPQIKDQQKHYIASENVYGNIYVVQPFKENGNDKTYYAYLFYDSSRADDERRTIHEVFRRNWDRANERKRYSEKMETEFAKQAIIVAKLDKTV